MTGDLEGITWARLVSMSSPNSGFWLQPVGEGRSLYSVIRTPYLDTLGIEKGGEVFRSNCSSCHMAHACTSGAPDLGTGIFSHGDSDWAIFGTVTEGIEGTAMIATILDDEEVWQVVAYIKSLRARTSTAAQTNVPSLASISEVTFSSLKNANREPENWMMYSGSFDGQRYSGTDQINRSTIRNLKVQWVHQLPTEETHSESTPIVVDNTMFLTASPDVELAINAGTGDLLWQQRRALHRVACKDLVEARFVLLSELHLG